jgi:hypothetical protein
MPVDGGVPARWLMVTFGLSVPEMMVVPPTTHQPSA